MLNRNAARRYANALFALSREQNVVDAVHADLGKLVDLMHSSAAWRFFVLEPSGGKTGRAGAIRDMFAGKVHALTLKFVEFIDHKNRINLFPYMVEEWTALYDRQVGIIRARVISAQTLDDAQKQNLEKRLGTRFGKKVILSVSHDPSLIGGLKIFIHDRVFDYSIDSHLQQLQKKLIYA